MSHLHLNFFIISLLLTLSISPPFAIATTPGVDFITETCNLTPHVDLCRTSAQNAADRDGMVVSMVRLAHGKTSQTVDFIKQFQTNKSDPKLEQSLEDCKELFVDAVDQLSNAEAKALDKSYSDVKLFLSAATGDIEACELALKNVESTEALFPSLVEKDTPVQQHISNAMAIASHLQS